MKIKAKKTFISGAIYANAGDTIETSDQVGDKLVGLDLAEAIAGDTIETSDQVGDKLVGLDLAEAIAEARPSQEVKPKPMAKRAAR